jgi:hypothetical protein
MGLYGEQHRSRRLIVCNDLICERDHVVPSPGSGCDKQSVIVGAQIIASQSNAVCSAANEPTVERAYREDIRLPVQQTIIWPTRDYSIKILAKFLGFDWRDTNPSGAASIEWYARWCNTRDPTIKRQVLEYNEDDCRAMRVLLDGIRVL